MTHNPFDRTAGRSFLPLFFSLIFVVFNVLGFFAKKYLIERRFTVTYPTPFVCIFAVLLAIPVARIVRKLWDRLSAFSSAPDMGPGREKISFRRTVRYAARILLLWSPYLLIRFPGNADIDTYWQLMQIYGFIPLNDHHPVFDTLVFGLFWRIGDLFGDNSISLFLYCGIQVVITAVVLSFAREYCLYRGVSEKGGKIIFLFYALYPIVPLFAQTMAKDMLHGWIFVLFIILFYELIYTRGAFLRKNRNLALFALVVLALMLTKKTGIYIAVLSLGLALLGCRGSRKRLLLLIFTPLLLYSGFYRVVDAFNPYVRGPVAEMLSVPSQQIAYLVRIEASELTDSDWSTLEGVYRNARELGDVYNPIRADATKGRWREEATGEQKKNFISLYWRKFVEHPYIMTMPVFALDYPLFCVDLGALGDESLLYYLDEVPAQAEITPMDQVLSSWAESTSPETFHRTMGSSYRSPFFALLSSAFHEIFLEIANSCAVLFSKCFIVTWIPLFCVFYKLFRNGWKSFLSDVPLLLNLAVLAVGPVVLPRYLVNSVYILPLVVSSIFWEPFRNTTFD